MEQNETKPVQSAWKIPKTSANRSASPISATNKSSNANGDSRSDKNSSSPASNSPTTSANLVSYNNNQSWKVVGSPPTNVIRSIPPSPDGDNQDPKSRRGSSNQSTPRYLNGGVDLTSRLVPSNSPPLKNQQGIPNGNADSTNGGKWGALGLQWPGPTSIWTEKNSPQSGKQGPRTSSTPPPPTKSEDVNSNSSYERDINSPPGISGNLPVPVPPNPQYRTHRSLSFSVGQHDTDLFGFAPTTNRRDSEGGLRFAYRHSLPVMEEETDDFSQFNMKFRARSKSSAAAYGVISGHPDLSHNDDLSEQYSESGSIWNNQGPQNDGPILHHRRSVPGTSDYGMWDSLNSSRQPAPSSSYLSVLPGLSTADRDRLRQRRFSHSQVPTYGNEYQYMDGNQDLRMLNHRAPTAIDSSFAHLVQRRHSVAGPAMSFSSNQPTRYISDALESLHLNNVPQATYTNDTGYASIPEDIDDYFDNDEHRTRAWNELGKGLPLHAVPSHGPLFLVEFKAGRTDLFYVAENSGNMVKKGDLVIVEADRGKDLGKVTNDSIMPHQVQLLQQQQADNMGDGHRMNKEIHPKRIYRLAQPAEVTMLVTKSQDEAKAMLVCQTKVRQKKLPMEVVDAEYQWDRRKLTFYFIAERRIDFRELVRDLFKIYKTRIWMCAVNPMMNKSKK
ncbi:7805_t:CDS:2 [Diversispora eburnea]|uniref:7805_t:CDS:1 n=1 Tax=Diversispora eburnea TaxID=1213867 RepID=A0A9N8V1L5_9GLOM|nr:7805_t:CDS:2 [Diversispora eburnea]